MLNSKRRMSSSVRFHSVISMFLPILLEKAPTQHPTRAVSTRLSQKIDVIALDAKDFSNVKVNILTSNADVKKLKDINVAGQFGTVKFSINFIKDQDVKKLSQQFVLHDPKNMVRGI